MGRRNNYFFYPVIDEGFDIIFGQTLKHVFTACLANTFTAAVFFITQDTKGDPGLIKDINGGTGYFFHPGIIAEVTTDKI